ncbi:unnamed protein product [Moneuplotes crassus]|uniref:Uncharacterized protein n=1 Tax=Euplotes crassus TaxID=5936 RepID=A0AAD2D965_EUPCR|nr:unnamed protein product [Moneuplotes crassus]
MEVTLEFPDFEGRWTVRCNECQQPICDKGVLRKIIVRDIILVSFIDNFSVNNSDDSNLLTCEGCRTTLGCTSKILVNREEFYASCKIDIEVVKSSKDDKYVMKILSGSFFPNILAKMTRSDSPVE